MEDVYCFQTNKIAVKNAKTFRLKPESLVKRSERWNFIGQILSTWCRLHDSEQAFLVEVSHLEAMFE